jgi:hypothetical protein
MGIGLGTRVKRVAFALPVVFLVAAAAAAAGGRTDRLELTTIGNHGRAEVTVGRMMAAHLRRAGADPHGRLLAERNGKTFMQFVRNGNGNCFGIKKGNAQRFSFTCWDSFPSPEHPLLDDSTFGANVGEPIHALDIQGFAADGVASIAVEDAAGTVLTLTPVLANVYNLDNAPPSAVRLVALGADGRPVFAVPR